MPTEVQQVQVLPSVLSGYRLYVVDDLWFSSIAGVSQSVDSLFSYSLDKNREVSEFASMVATAKAAPLAPLLELELLSRLIELCSSKGIGLTICNFASLEADFESTINSPHNGLLLDVRNSEAATIEAANTYGIDKLADLLDGKRPKADICFITQLPAFRTRKYISDQKNRSKWWPLLTVPFIQKDETYLKPDVDSFFAYFTEGRSFEPAQQMARFLVENERTHPSPQKPPSAFPVPLANSTDEESFKALYFWDSNTENSFGKYAIRLDAVVSHLQLLGVNSTAPRDCQVTFYFPVQPGGVFLLLLRAFVDSIRSTNGVEDVGTIEVGVEHSVAYIQIPLTGDLASRIKARLLATDGGRGTTRLKELLRFDVQAVADEFGLGKAPWPGHPRPVGWSKRTPYLVVDPIFFEDSIRLTWRANG